MSASLALFSGLSKSSKAPFGSASNAAFVGAKTVNGPLLDKALTKSAACTAFTKVLWSFEFTATLTTLGCDSLSLTSFCPASATAALVPLFVAGTGSCLLLLQELIISIAVQVRIDRYIFFIIRYNFYAAKSILPVYIKRMILVT